MKEARSVKDGSGGAFKYGGKLLVEVLRTRLELKGEENEKRCFILQVHKWAGWCRATFI
ncbi:hypothetical protein ES703_110047 [subsurface metagenome]